MNLQDKVAVVTGAGSGIGRATALRLAREGAKVLVADFVEEGGKDTVGAIVAAGGDASFVLTDVSQEEDVRHMIEMAESVYGGLDVIHNNAGVLSGPRFPDAPPQYWSRAIDINLRGVLYGIYYGVPALKRRGGGVIVNTSSRSGLTPFLLDPVYAATKAAVVNLTRSLTFLHEEAGIRVNCVCPGLVRTALERNSTTEFDAQNLENFKRRRAGRTDQPSFTPDDIATAVLRLIQDDTLKEIVFLGYGRGRRASGAQMTAVLMERIESLGGRFLLGTAMQALVVTDGKVAGVTALGDGGVIEVQADAVILATGGFQGNPELLARYVTPNADRMYLRSNPWSTGDGFLAATAAGAAVTTSLDTFYGHAVTAPPVRFNAFEFQNMSHKYGQYAVALNLDGHRFADESAGTGEELLNYHLCHQPRATAIYIIDEAIGRQEYDGGPLPRVAIARARQAGGPVVEATTLKELAEKMEAWGPPASASLHTLQTYNAAVKAGNGSSLFPTRIRNRLPIEHAPFSAVLVRASITFTCGGLRSDLDMRVLRRTSSTSTLPLVTADISEFQVAPIPGLFVAGSDLGGTNNRGYMGGLSQALVTGRAAGAAAAKDVRAGRA